MARQELISQTFVDLADTLVDGYDLAEFLELLTVRCVELLDVSAAGVLLADAHGHLRVLASSSERMRLLELLETQSAEGPCFDCWTHGGVIRSDDLSSEARWPRFGVAASAAGFLSVYALPMRLRAERIGSLNLFDDGAAGLSASDEALGQALADIATIGILHSRTVNDHTAVTTQLQAALDSRVSLEQAKGMVAEQTQGTAEEAFDLLRRFARRRSRRLGDVVIAVLDRDLTAEDLADPASASERPDP